MSYSWVYSTQTSSWTSLGEVWSMCSCRVSWCMAVLSSEKTSASSPSSWCASAPTYWSRSSSTCSRRCRQRFSCPRSTSSSSRRSCSICSIKCLIRYWSALKSWTTKTYAHFIKTSRCNCSTEKTWCRSSEGANIRRKRRDDSKQPKV